MPGPLPIPGNGPGWGTCRSAEKWAQVGLDHFDGDFVRTKMPAVVARSGAHLVINWTMLDDEGNNIDLSSCCPSSSSSGSSDTPASSSSSVSPPVPCGTVRFRLGSYEPLARQMTMQTVTGSITDPESGAVRAVFENIGTIVPGIYIGEFIVLNGDTILCSNQMYVFIEKSLFDGDPALTGPPLMSEIRLFLRDNGFNDNELIDHVDFDAAEIAMAVQLPVAQWEEMLPPLSRNFNTQTFPFRYYWLKGICAHLFMIAAEHYRRNRLPYQAAGNSLDDKNRVNDYEAKALQLSKEYETWVRQKKIQLNIEAGWGDIGSTYTGRA